MGKEIQNYPIGGSTVEPHFADDYAFKAEAVPATTNAKVSDVFILANSQAGIKIHGWVDTAIVTGSAANVVLTIEGGADKDATASTAWKSLAVGTVGGGTAAATSASGTDIIEYIPAPDAPAYFRVKMQASGAGITGAISVCPEPIVR